MANKITWEHRPPAWLAPGDEPPPERKERGFTAGYKPPAGFFNWFWSGMYRTVSELQEKLGAYSEANETEKSSHFENRGNPHRVTAAQAGAYTKEEADSRIRALIEDALRNQHPVGHVYITQAKEDNPNERFAGTWELTSIDKTLRGAGKEELAGMDGGADTATLAVANLVNHVHNVPGQPITTSYVSLDHVHTASAWLGHLGGHEHNYTHTAASHAGHVQWYSGGSAPIWVNSYAGATTSGGGGHDHGGVGVSVGWASSAGYTLNHAHTATIGAVSTNSTSGAVAKAFSIKNKYELMYVWKRVA